MVRTWLVFTVILFLGLAGNVGNVDRKGTPRWGGRRAAAAEPAGAENSPAGSAAVPAGSTPPAETGAMTAEVPMVDAAAQAATPAKFGVGARLRLTSVPKWMLGLFLDQSVPLTSYTAGLEFFRRSGNFDFVLGLAYQSLSPNAGNWLGKGKDSSQDTDYVQFDGLASYSLDGAFIMHTEFTENVGMHYGGGVGIGIVTGRMLRTSNGSQPGCRLSPGDPTKCYPVVCPQGPCSEAQLRATEGGSDTASTPSRYSDGHVPTVYPIVNLVTGLDIRLPNVPGLAMKFEIGYFFPYFFFGPSVAYQI
ncbi:MAG: hypothetical protein ABJA82_08555 [Myxococcales bacterium]